MSNKKIAQQLPFLNTVRNSLFIKKEIYYALSVKTLLLRLGVSNLLPHILKTASFDYSHPRSGIDPLINLRGEGGIEGDAAQRASVIPVS